MEIENLFVYRVQENETLKDICLKFNTDIENITRNNREIPLFEGELIEIKINEYITHFVKPAETLLQIATTYEITVEELKQQNNLSEDKLYIGQRLKIYNKKTL